MLSLTVDRTRFASPEDAHRAITGGSYVARFMRLLGLSTWLWVLEFQTKSGDGWPHWHVLIDLEDVGGPLDLTHAWSLWRGRWHLGRDRHRGPRPGRVNQHPHPRPPDPDPRPRKKANK